ncbi:hypothetical protein Tco_1526991 [Tanacetum coccineum]
MFEESINVLNLEVKLRNNALVENKKKLEKAKKERNELQLTLEKFKNSSKSLNNLLESQIIDKFKTRLGYNAASSTTASRAVESFVSSSEINGDSVEPKIVRKNSFRPPVIEDWNSDDGSEVEIIPKDKTVSSSIKKLKFVMSARETVEKVIRPVWNNTSRVNHKNFANKMTHPHPNRRFVPQTVLTRSGKINTAGASVNTVVRPINTASSKTTVSHPRPISNAYKKGYSQDIRATHSKRSIRKKELLTVVALGT